VTLTSTVTISDYSDTTRADVVTNTDMCMQQNGGFILSTRTFDSRSSSIYTMRPQSGPTATNTTTLMSYTLMSYNGTRVPEPNYMLPSIVLQFQSQWEEYMEPHLIPWPIPPSQCDFHQGRVPAGDIRELYEPSSSL
jgi:hypothetical protein